MSGSLVHSPADIMRHLLVLLGGGSLPSVGGLWPMFISQEPDAPDNLITFYDTSGRSAGRNQVDGERQEHHGFQLRLRSESHSVGWTKARALAVQMDGISYRNVTISGMEYIVYAVSRVGDVLAVGTEAPLSKRFVFTVNAVVALRQI